MSQQSLTIKVKKLHTGAVVPAYAHGTDAGMDLVATSKTVEDGLIVYGTGLAFEIPEGYVGLIFPRSSIFKKNLSLTNAVGVLDSGYRGEVKFKFACDVRRVGYEVHVGILGQSTDLIPQTVEYEIGDKIGQLIILPYPKVSVQVTDYLSQTDRGEGGFGSTGT